VAVVSYYRSSFRKTTKSFTQLIIIFIVIIHHHQRPMVRLNLFQLQHCSDHLFLGLLIDIPVGPYFHACVDVAPFLLNVRAIGFCVVKSCHLSYKSPVPYNFTSLSKR
jgi:hypothetical protein